MTYYDHAWFYHDGESEPMMGRLLSRYPRESYCLATKMPCAIIDSLEQAKDIFAKQFERSRPTTLTSTFCTASAAAAGRRCWSLGSWTF